MVLASVMPVHWLNTWILRAESWSIIPRMVSHSHTSAASSVVPHIHTWSHLVPGSHLKVTAWVHHHLPSRTVVIYIASRWTILGMVLHHSSVSLGLSLMMSDLHLMLVGSLSLLSMSSLSLGNLSLFHDCLLHRSLIPHFFMGH